MIPPAVAPAILAAAAPAAAAIPAAATTIPTAMTAALPEIAAAAMPAAATAAPAYGEGLALSSLMQPSTIAEGMNVATLGPTEALTSGLDLAAVTPETAINASEALQAGAQTGNLGAPTPNMLPTGPGGVPYQQMPAPLEIVDTAIPGAASGAQAAGQGGIGEYMSKIGDKMLEALPGAAVSGAGTMWQQYALDKADQERYDEEERAQRALSAKQAEMAGAVTEWGKENLSPEGMDANRVASEEEIFNRLYGYGNDNPLDKIEGNVSGDYIKAMADATKSTADQRRNYAGLTSKMLSHGGQGNKLNLSGLVLGRKLDELGGDYSSITSGANRSLLNISPNTASMIGGTLLQGMAPALSKL
jgi:hypothetical protein